MSREIELRARAEQRAILLDRARKMLVEGLRLELAPEDIDGDTPLFATGLGLDSVDAVELLLLVEDHLGARLSDDAPSRCALRTVNTLLDFVEASSAR